MAERSKVEGVAIHCQLSLATGWVRVAASECEQVTSDSRSGDGFSSADYSRLMAEKVPKLKNQYSYFEEKASHDLLNDIVFEM